MFKKLWDWIKGLFAKKATPKPDHVDDHSAQPINLEPALALIKQFEGLRLKAYLCPAGIPTIGWGTTVYPTGQKVRLGDTITRADADAFLKHDVGQFVQAVVGSVQVPITNNEFCSLVSFTYNVGPGALQRSSLLRLLNQGAARSVVANEFGKWVFASGQKLNGLVRRREAEKALFLKP